MWLRLDDLWDSGVSLSLGRQKVQDERAWWWEEDLELVSLSWESERFDWEFALGTQLARSATHELFFDPEKRGVWHGVARAGWQWHRGQRIELLALHSRDFSPTEGLGHIVDLEKEDELDAQRSWLSLRLLGTVPVLGAHRVDYWFDLAGMIGSEVALGYEDFEREMLVVEERIHRATRGYAFDLGATWTAPLRHTPRLTLGWAHGSGGRHDYRQSGLQRNTADFGGTHDLHYYGELFDPELSNLHVLTVGFGVATSRRSSLDLILHQSWQAVAREELGDVGLELQPDGRSRSLGQEVDLVLGFASGRIEAKLTGSTFRAGTATDGGVHRWNWGLGLEFLFAF